MDFNTSLGERVTMGKRDESENYGLVGIRGCKNSIGPHIVTQSKASYLINGQS